MTGPSHVCELNPLGDGMDHLFLWDVTACTDGTVAAHETDTLAAVILLIVIATIQNASDCPSTATYYNTKSTSWHNEMAQVCAVVPGYR